MLLWSAGGSLLPLVLYMYMLSSTVQPSAGEAAADHKPQQVVMIDAGSSGSRVHVYTYTLPKAPAHYATVTLPEPQLRITPGLSSFAPDGEGAGESLQPLIEFAKEQVPAGLHATTRIYVMATAGLRMLPVNQSEAILAVVRQQLAASDFAFQDEWVKILPGASEGMYAWAAMNFASGRLEALAQKDGPSLRQKVLAPEPEPTWGVFELGGASMQVTFMPEDALPKEFSNTLALPGVRHPLYTHSFLGYGLDVAWFRAAMLVQQRQGAKDPCLPSGYTSPSGIKGSGSFKECQRIAAQLLPTIPCSHPACSIEGQYLPRLAGAHMATENFCFTLQKLDLPETASLDNISRAGATFCKKSWQQLQRDYIKGRGIPAEYLLKACFGSAYIWTLLRDAFHVSTTTATIRFTNSVTRPDGTKVEVNWLLGALLVEVIDPQHGGLDNATGRPAVGSNSRYTESIWSEQTVLLVCMTVFGVIALVACLHWDAFSVKHRMGHWIELARIQGDMAVSEYGTTSNDKYRVHRRSSGGGGALPLAPVKTALRGLDVRSLSTSASMHKVASLVELEPLLVGMIKDSKV